MATKLRRSIEAAFREVNENEPAVVRRTRRKKGAAAAERQKRAIAFSKGRRAARGN